MLLPFRTTFLPCSQSASSHVYPNRPPFFCFLPQSYFHHHHYHHRHHQHHQHQHQHHPPTKQPSTQPSKLTNTIAAAVEGERKKNLLMMLFDLLLVVYSSLFMMMTIQSHWYKSKMKIKKKKLFDTDTLRSACFLATAISSALAGSLANCLRRPDSTYT